MFYHKNVIEIFPTEIPQYLQRRHWGFPAFLTYDVTKVVPTKVHLVSHMYVIQRFVSYKQFKSTCQQVEIILIFAYR
jgi:hypothetical protein